MTLIKKYETFFKTLKNRTFLLLVATTDKLIRWLQYFEEMLSEEIECS